jgi:trehalose synthase
MAAHTWRIDVDDYAPLIGEEALARIRHKAHRLRGLRVLHLSSTFYGGGVAELLSSATLLERSLGLRADWRLIQGGPDFFAVTKKLHNALQGGEIRLTDLKRDVYEETIAQNALRLDMDYDFVIVHDPQPLPMIRHYRRTCPWVWRCHVDLSRPDAEVWRYLAGFVDEYDAMVVSLPEYAQQVAPPQVFVMPAIDPFSLKNRELTDAEVAERLRRHGIADDLPLVVQISRFDRWKDPEGVIEAFRLAASQVDARLVLLGNVATDDPEGQQVFESLLGHKSDRALIMTIEDSALVNALQRRAAVVLQKSLREGFGLTVTEAMWKGTPVIGGDVGGIRHQIRDGETGFLVASVDDAARRIVELVRDPSRRDAMGRRARDAVRERFLMTRMVEQELDLMNAFEPRFTMNHRHAATVGTIESSRRAPPGRS